MSSSSAQKVDPPELTMEELKDRIKHVLETYPAISPTMLQAGLGPQLAPAIWRPALEELISEGVIEQRSESKLSPNKRHISYSILSLT